MSDLEAPLSERLASLVDPLREEQRRIAGEIVELEAKLKRLRQEERNIEVIVKRVDGSYSPPGPKGPRKSGTNPHGAKGGRWDETITEYLDRDGVATDHIVAANLYRAIKTDAIAHGKGQRGYPGHASVKSALERMHAAGTLRRVGTGKGGHAIYATLDGGGVS